MATSSDSGFVIGIDLGGTNMVAAAVSQDGSRVVGQQSEPTRAADGADAVVGRMAQMVARAQAAVVEAGGAPDAVIGVGVNLRTPQLQAPELASSVADMPPPVPPVGLDELLGLPGDAESGALAVVSLRTRQRTLGVIVDGFLGEEDVVVQPLDERLGTVPHVSSASVRQSGELVLILDADAMAIDAARRLDEGTLRGAAAGSEDARRRVHRVLVVEDSLTVREVERQMLTRAGYAVDVAVDGLDGWNALQRERYDLVLSDVDMPRMNGLELVRRIRADRRLAPIPVVMVSYKDREEDRLAGLEAGATAYLTKGAFHDRTLLDTVADLIAASAG